MPPGGPPAPPPPGAPFSAAGGPPGAIPPSGPCACAALRPKASITLAPPSKIFLTFMTVLHTRLRTPTGVSPGNIARLSLVPPGNENTKLGWSGSKSDTGCEQAEAEAAGGKPLNIVCDEYPSKAAVRSRARSPARRGRGRAITDGTRVGLWSAPSGSGNYLGEDHGRRRKTGADNPTGAATAAGMNRATPAAMK